MQATVQGWMHKEPTALTAEEENTLTREAAIEEVMDIGCDAEFHSAAVGLHPRLVQGAGRA